VDALIKAVAWLKSDFNDKFCVMCAVNMPVEVTEAMNLYDGAARNLIMAYNYNMENFRA
jgi:hypothetical protein